MKIQVCWLLALVIPISMAGADQRKLGEGNATAARTGQSSLTVNAAVRFLLKNVGTIRDDKIREATYDGLRNSETCVAHRVGVTEEVKASILAKLKEEGLLPEGGDPQAGVFPPLRNDGGECPHLPLTISSAPGSGFGSHHSYPGGLAAHEAFNQQSAMSLAAVYRTQYGKDILIDQDWMIGAPAWHDWAKMMVFQWNADGTTFNEFNFGGTGRIDNYRAPGDSRTSAHHILGLAETMARGLPPGLVITQACAHSAPTMGNEYKVVNWLRAAALIARIDPAAKGYLVIDKDGQWRLPPLGHLWDGLNLNENGQANVLVEYQIHNLSDADYIESIPAVSNAELLLRTVAKQFGYEPEETAVYNNEFRNFVLAMIGPDRLFLLYSSYGLGRVAQEIEALGVHHAPK